jgi:hypothetical protein
LDGIASDGALLDRIWSDRGGEPPDRELPIYTVVAALYQLIVSPYRWEKTEHGLAKRSRLADEMTRALLNWRTISAGWHKAPGCRQRRTRARASKRVSPRVHNLLLVVPNKHAMVACGSCRRKSDFAPQP